MTVEFYLIPWKQKLIPSVFYYLGYIYIRGKTIQGLLLASILIEIMVFDSTVGKDFDCVTFLQDICTSLKYRNDLRSYASRNAYIAPVMLALSLACFIVYPATFRLYLFKYLGFGFVLSRAPWVLIRNGKWADGLRALRSANGKATRLNFKYD